MTLNREMLVNHFLIFLTALLLFANCASKQEGKTAQANNAVSGTLTINGKAENLSHVYARRMVWSISPKLEYFALVFTNKPVAEDVLLKFLYTGGFYPKEGKVQGLLLTISPVNDKRLDVFILHRSADDGYINTNSAIESLSITGERVTAKATEAGTQSGKNWNYSVSVDLPFKR